MRDDAGRGRFGVLREFTNASLLPATTPAGRFAPRVLFPTAAAFELESFLRNEAKIDEDGVKEYVPLLNENEVDEEGLRVLATDPKRDIEARLEKWGISVDADRLKLAEAIVRRFGGGGGRK